VFHFCCKKVFNLVHRYTVYSLSGENPWCHRPAQFSYVQSIQADQ